MKVYNSIERKRLKKKTTLNMSYIYTQSLEVIAVFAKSKGSQNPVTTRIITKL